MDVRLKGIKRVRANGRVYYYHRKTNTRLPSAPGSPEFTAALSKLQRKEVFNMPSNNYRLAAAWWSIFHTQRVAVSNVIVTAMGNAVQTNELREALTKIAPSIYPGAYSPHKLGRWLSRNGGIPIKSEKEDTVYIFVSRGNNQGKAIWQLQREESIEEFELDDALPEGFLSAVA